MSLISQVLDRIATAADAVFGEKPENVKIGFPPNIEMGDLTVECFPLAKQFRKSPVAIAADIADRLKSDDLIQGATAAGPYVNLTLLGHRYFREACKNIFENQPFKSPSDASAGRRIMVEYLSPNTNKPLHLGHIRNGALGMAISNLYESVGHTVVKANLINDRGVHICKSMLAWQKYGNGATPESEGLKGDVFVGKWYVRFGQEAQTDPSLESEVQAMLRRWEKGDPATVEIWEKMNHWVYDGFSKTYETLGLKFDAFYYESQTYQHGKGIIDEGLGKGVFEKDAKGNTVFSLPIETFGKDENGAVKRITVLRPDGTSLYITQDIG
ncbi:MAG: arginine--tRNA ligase, partial [Deltaproteobacteria bacterium]|nr:arginine--tRNA ligase [Deltaproteobacteria bacterium]